MLSGAQGVLGIAQKRGADEFHERPVSTSSPFCGGSARAQLPLHLVAAERMLRNLCVGVPLEGVLERGCLLPFDCMCASVNELMSREGRVQVGMAHVKRSGVRYPFSGKMPVPM